MCDGFCTDAKPPSPKSQVYVTVPVQFDGTEVAVKVTGVPATASAGAEASQVIVQGRAVTDMIRWESTAVAEAPSVTVSVTW